MRCGFLIKSYAKNLYLFLPGCMLGIFFQVFLVSAEFVPKPFFSKNYFRNIISMRPDLSPNCLQKLSPDHCGQSRPSGHTTFFMLNSAEHEIYPAHKC